MYNPHPVIDIKADSKLYSDWDSIVAVLNETLAEDAVIAIEVYPTVDLDAIEQLAKRLAASLVIDARYLFQDMDLIQASLAPDITEDRILGRRTLFKIADFLDPDRVARAEMNIAKSKGRRVIWGTGASLIQSVDQVIYADISRWEATLRYRTNRYSNWMSENANDDPQKKLKQAYFVEWVMADQLKLDLNFTYSWYLDMNRSDEMKLIRTEDLLSAYKQLSQQPFRLKPFFDEGVWGGHWMQEELGVGQTERNLAWCFDGVPEENSLLLGFKDAVLETPAINLVFAEARALMGERVFGRFGYSFPIRFNLLDTMGGQNLSLQVHPQTSYIQNVFGMPYTQDESYYILTAKPGTYVYAGQKTGIDRSEMIRDLYRAEAAEIHFDADRYINRIPVQAHDHISYPGGSIHCSGKDMVVLEISSTPNRFTFKLWDWGRVDLDGLPRPINLEHGLKNVAWERDTAYVERELFNQIEPLEEGDGYRIERTGLHELEFIETKRYHFTKAVRHRATGSVRVLNLVSGEGAWVESIDGSFSAFRVNYAETFIVPAAVGDFTVRPLEDDLSDALMTIEATVR